MMTKITITEEAMTKIEALTMTTGSMTMTDEELAAVLRWRGSALQEGAFFAAADRIEQLTAERDAAYARGYADAETEISKSALGQKIDFLHSHYANAVEQIKDLNELLEEAQTEWSKYASSWMTAEGKLADAEALIEAQAKDHASNNIRFAEAEHRAKTAEAERDRLREALGKLECKCSSNCDWERDDVCPSWIARAALKGESHD